MQAQSELDLFGMDDFERRPVIAPTRPITQVLSELYLDNSPPQDFMIPVTQSPPADEVGSAGSDSSDDVGLIIAQSSRKPGKPGCTTTTTSPQEPRAVSPMEYDTPPDSVRGELESLLSSARDDSQSQSEGKGWWLRALQKMCMCWADMEDA